MRRHSVAAEISHVRDARTLDARAVRQRLVEAWLGRRAGDWQQLKESLARHRQRRDLTFGESVDLVNRYKRAQGDLALARSELPDAAVTRQLHGLLVEVARELTRPAVNHRAALFEFLTTTVPEQAQILRSRILALAALFLFSMFIGGWLVGIFPELRTLFLSAGMIRSVESGQLWTEQVFGLAPPSVLALGIMSNNIVVTMTAFALGVFYGLGTLYIVCMNGLLLGAAVTFTRQFGLADELLDFVTAHGIVEISVIIIGAAAGLRLGEAIAKPGLLTRTEAFRRAAIGGWSVCLFCLPFLVVAGVIESYVSPSGLPYAAKFSFGLVYEIVFLVCLTGWWTRWLPRASAIGTSGVATTDPGRAKRTLPSKVKRGSI